MQFFEYGKPDGVPLVFLSGTPIRQTTLRSWLSWPPKPVSAACFEVAPEARACSPMRPPA